MHGNWLFWVRRLHLYLSVFFAPLLLLFVITGWAQTMGYVNWGSTMWRVSEIHKAQYFPTSDTGTLGKLRISGQTGTSKGAKIQPTSPMKWLVVAMSMALVISISLGIILAFTMVRNRIPVWIALTLGIATPVLLLAFAHIK